MVLILISLNRSDIVWVCPFTNGLLQFVWQSVIIYKNISMYLEQQYEIKVFKFYICTSCTSSKLIWQTLGGMSKMTYPHWLKRLSDFKQSSRITAIGHIALVAINGTITLEPYHMSWQGWAGTIIHLMTMTTRVPFYEHKFTFIPAWISNYIHHKVWDEITYPFPTSTVQPLKFGNG